MTNPIEIQAFSSNNQIHIDDDIGRDGITAKQIKEELSNHRGSIEIHINSAGGSCYRRNSNLQHVESLFWEKDGVY